MTTRRDRAASLLSPAIPNRCTRCGQFPAEYLLTGEWQQHLAELVARYSGEGVEPDLRHMDVLELWGLFLRYLRMEGD